MLIAKQTSIKYQNGSDYEELYPNIDNSKINISASQITSGTLSVVRGGTGQTTLEGVKSWLGINSSSTNLPSKIIWGKGQALSSTSSLYVSTASFSSVEGYLAFPFYTDENSLYYVPPVVYGEYDVSRKRVKFSLTVFKDGKFQSEPGCTISYIIFGT